MKCGGVQDVLRGCGGGVSRSTLSRLATSISSPPTSQYSGPNGDGVAYEGATVLDPKVGYYDKPVATLDFASLHPSTLYSFTP